MKVAVAYENGEIGEHFGHAKEFAIYDFNDENLYECTKSVVDASALSGHNAMSNLMRDNGVFAVIVGNMGPEAYSKLLSYRIIPVVGYCGDADTAAQLFVFGQLPTGDEGGCGGGCGGCGGSCGCGDGDEGGCGGGCGCGC